MKTDKGIIVVTFDDVVAYTTYDLYLYLCRHYSYYGKFLDLYDLYTKKEIYERKDQNLLSCLKSDRFFSLISEKRQLAAINNMLTVLYSTYYNETSLYSSSILSDLGRKGLNNPVLKENKGIDDIIFIVKYKTDAEKARKEAFLKAIYGEKVNVKYIRHYSDKYSDVVKNIPWTLFITDDIDAVEELAAGDIDHKEFLVPKYGYNEAKPELVELIKQKSGTLSYYEIED